MHCKHCADCVKSKQFLCGDCAIVYFHFTGSVFSLLCRKVTMAAGKNVSPEKQGYCSCTHPGVNIPLC